MTPPSLTARLQATCERRGAAIAVRDGATALSYRELWTAILQSADWLAEATPRGGSIAIAANNSIEYLLAWWGAQRLGRLIFELNPLEPEQKNATILERIAPELLIASQPIGRSATRQLTPSEFGAARRSASPPSDPAQPGACACVVFTSGTTGAPKGVMLSTANLAAVTDAILDYLPLQESDRYALVLPLFHTYAKSVMLTTLFSGGELHLRHDFADLPAFVAGLAQQRITAFSGVPYHINMLLRRAPLEQHDLSALRWITISGSHCRHDALQELARRIPSARVIYMYGMTETSTRATALPAERLAEKPGSCGRPIRGVRLEIRDDAGHALPAGQTGALWIAGPNVMMGYWGDDDLSRETIRDGWLRTGDVAHLDQEGFLFLHGRSDDIIKSAGERISALEIEAALEQHPGVVEAAVVAVPHPVLGEAPLAWVVPRVQLSPPTAEDLRGHCARLLTPHKIPREFRVASELPKTASGKVQKNRLRAGEVTR